MAEYILPVKRLIEQFRRIPGVGAKTAARYAFAVLNFENAEAEQFADAILGVKRDVYRCPICFSLSGSPDSCDICSSPDRDRSVICVVEEVKDVMTMERVRSYKGTYHVLGGALSPIDNITPRDLKIKELIERVERDEVKEIIVATNPTPKGDTTAAYIAKLLEGSDTRVTRLAYGIPVGADIEYADEVTLERAMEGRRFFGETK